MVEGVNSDLRRYIPALQRRSKCFFRSLETMKAVFKIFVHAFNDFAYHKAKFPSLKKSFSICFKILIGNSQFTGGLDFFLIAKAFFKPPTVLVVSGYNKGTYK